MEDTQSLGFTFHPGEDFRHILSGLRRVDEAVEHLIFMQEIELDMELHLECLQGYGKAKVQ